MTFPLSPESIVASALPLRSDFLTQVACGSSLGSSGEVYVLHAHAYLAATWTFWSGCG